MIRAPVPCTEVTIHPTALQRTRAYLRSGSLPPLPAMPLEADVVLSFLTSAAVCLLAGYLLGSAFA